MSQSTITLTEALRALSAVTAPEDDQRIILIPATASSSAVTLSMSKLKQLIQSIAQAAATQAAPTPQTGVAGTTTTYPYSTGTTTDLPHSIFSAVFKCYQYGGEVRVTHKLWGSTADYNDGNYISSNIPCATTGANGALHRTLYSRLINTTLTESTSTTDEVHITYPNYTDGSTKTLALTRATTAKAGIMSTAQCAILVRLSYLNLSEVTTITTSDTGTTKTQVAITYTDPTADNSTRQFILHAASMERAGVMTAKMVEELKDDTWQITDLRTKLQSLTERVAALES